MKQKKEKQGDSMSEPRWISVEERLPPSAEWFVGLSVWNERDFNSGEPIIISRARIFMPGADFARDDDKLTHWMPLPSPPEEKS